MNKAVENDDVRVRVEERVGLDEEINKQREDRCTLVNRDVAVAREF